MVFAWFLHAFSVPHLLVSNQWIICLSLAPLRLGFGIGFGLFRIIMPTFSLVSDLWLWIEIRCFSPQLYNLWIAAACFVFYSLQKVRNQLHFDNITPSCFHLRTNILAHIRFLAQICPGYVHFGTDRSILLDLGIPWRVGEAPKDLILSQHPPLTVGLRSTLTILQKIIQVYRRVVVFFMTVVVSFWVAIQWPWFIKWPFMLRSWQSFLLQNWLLLRVGTKFG